MAQDGTLTEPLSAALEREHREIDDGIQSFVADADDHDRQGLADAVHALRRHIYAEEELMFPALQDAGLVGPVLVMLREHAQMWPLLDALDLLLGSSDPDATELHVVCTDLFDLLQRHNPKEETILYPQADGVLTSALGAHLRAFLDSGDLPPGWICQHLRG